MLARLLLDPLAGLGGGGAPAEEPSGQPSLDSTAGIGQAELQERPDPSGGSAVGAGAGGPEGTTGPAAQTAAEQERTIREAAAYYGLDLSQFEDDTQAFAWLAQQALAGQQRNYYTELGQRIAPHADAVQQYLRDYQARQQAQPAAQRKAWEAPEFDERWLALVDRDPTTGRFVPKPGVNPLLADKVNDYSDHIDQWTTQLARQPMEALSGLIEQVATRLIESRFGQHQATTEAQGIIAGNESWLYQVDAAGRRQLGHDGKFLPTPLGARYYTHIQVLQRSGVKDARTLDALAKQLLSADLAAGNVQAGQARTQPAIGRPNINPGQAVTPVRRPLVPGATDPSQEGLSLAEQMRQAMAEEGITDADFAQTFN